MFHTKPSFFNARYVLASAGYAKSAETVSHFHYVSAQGANEKSSVLYNRVKGEIQAGLTALDFNQLSIYQPALLLCKRTESRPGEAVARALGNVMSKLTNAGTVCSRVSWSEMR